MEDRLGLAAALQSRQFPIQQNQVRVHPGSFSQQRRHIGLL